MRYARVKDERGTVHFALIEGERARLLDGPPWDGGEPRTDDGSPLSEVVLLAPVVPSKVVGVGRNYVDHIEEMGYDRPVEPTVFTKPPTTVIGPGDDVELPPRTISDEVEHEAELAVVIGRTARHVRAEDARAYIFGYTIADDVSARDLQRSDATLARGKGWDTFCPTGPWIETEVAPDDLPVRCRVNGDLRQDGRTSSLLFGIDAIVSYITGFMTLTPGDLILTGSPGGSGRIVAGDRVQIEIDGIGTLVHGVVAAGAPTSLELPA